MIIKFRTSYFDNERNKAIQIGFYVYKTNSQ